jgi:hypothetical protein
MFGPSVSASGKALMASCSCGWWSALHQTARQAEDAWREHVESRSASASSPAPGGPRILTAPQQGDTVAP